METSLPRPRGFAVSERTFRLIAVAGLTMLIVVVASGALTRLTGSGLGCEHWPGCKPGAPLEIKGSHAVMEFSNRVVGGLTVLATLATWVASLLLAGARRSLRWLAFATFVGAAAQAPLGAVTVRYELNPWLVGAHFLLSMVVLTLGTIVVLVAFERGGDPVPGSIRALGLVVAAAGGALLATGVLATAAGPHSGSVAVPRIGSFQPAMWVHVRATAIFAIAFAVLLAWLLANRSGHVRLALAAFALLLAQMAVGELQYRTKLPWELVVVHVTLAAITWAALSALVAMLWRPRPSAVPVRRMAA
jgi:cytochrome c oxidase assembly protein subunit 15